MQGYTWTEVFWSLLVYGVGGGIALFVVTHYVFPALLIALLLLLCPAQRGGY